MRNQTSAKKISSIHVFIITVFKSVNGTRANHYYDYVDNDRRNSNDYHFVRDGLIALRDIDHVFDGFENIRIFSDDCKK